MAVVISRTTYDRLATPALSLVDFMRASLLFGLDDALFEREDSPAREVEL